MGIRLASEAREPRLECSERGSVPYVDVDPIPESRCAWVERVSVDVGVGIGNEYVVCLSGAACDV